MSCDESQWISREPVAKSQVFCSSCSPRQVRYGRRDARYEMRDHPESAYLETCIPHRVSRISSRIPYPASRICVLASSRNHHRHSLHRPERSERADSISGKCLHPTWPADFQHAEGTLQRQNERDETELPHFDADVEADTAPAAARCAAGRRWSARWRNRIRAAARTQTPPPTDAGW